jgi:RNA polymerase sigma factor (sigma-70 family)
MLNDPRLFHGMLASIARRTSNDPAMLQDLIQEAAVHLWQRLEQHPGQQRSWYLQSCRDHLRNYLRQGRSVDSPRRQQFLRMDGVPAEMVADLSPSEEDVLNSVCARDLIEELLKVLAPPEQQTLNCLAEGLSLRETAVRLATSHTTVNKHRRKIEVLVMKLSQTQSAHPTDIPPAANGRPARSPSFK